MDRTTCNQTEYVVLPLPPDPVSERSDMAVYARFMSHLRHVPNNRMEIRILSAIQFTADMLDYSDAQVAKALVDLGLRAPRLAFPADFLKFADASLMRSGWEVGGPNAALLGLQEHWNRIGENRFGAASGDYSLISSGMVLQSL